MKLISDSGSTKTDWLLTDKDFVVASCRTQGINPFIQSEEFIESVIRDELLPQIPLNGFLSDIRFYGAGCRSKQGQMVHAILSRHFSGANIEVASDMLCAARALCGHEAAIACILGTGANSCLFDGTEIVNNISPLGYILGDEGSGAFLGKVLLANIYKHLLSEELAEDFRAVYSLTVDEVLQRVYREPLPNRYLASFTPFLKKHESHPEIQQLLFSAFDSFFKRNILAYHYPELPVHFVGSIAYFFQNSLQEAACHNNVNIGRIIREPLERWRNI